MLKENDREFLQEGTQLYLEKIFSNAPHEIGRFLITGQNGSAGSSAVCYEARYCYLSGDLQIPGTLKEFYPRQFEADATDLKSRGLCGGEEHRFLVDLVRVSDPDEKKDGQLRIKGPFTRENFFALRGDYVRAYRRMYEAKASEPDLYETVGNFELYKSFPDDGDPENYTVYIWVPFDPKIKTFGAFLEDVCRETAENSHKSRNLKTILEAVRELSAAIGALHMKRICHLDISPNNFGLKLSGGRPNGGVSLFDINTIYSEDDRPTVISAGTRGFRSPELLNGQIHQGCDFFSIGACLYYALVMREATDPATGKPRLENVRFAPSPDDQAEKRVQTYNDALARIEADLVTSPLFNGCDFNEDSVIIRGLASILKKCLCVNEAGERYASAFTIARELEEVIEKWNGHIDRENSSLEEMVPAPGQVSKEALAEQSVRLGAEGAIQWLLYRRPLYVFAAGEGTGAPEKRLNILVLGGGNYASRFVDTAFQLMQIDGYRTDITLVSKDMPEDRSNFLAQRPAFCDFFDTVSYGGDGEPQLTPSARCGAASYGTLRFLPLRGGAVFSASPEKQPGNRALIKEIRETTGLAYTYVFIAMHNDALNLAAARAAEAVFQGCVPVNFVVFGDRTDEPIRPGEPLPGGDSAALNPLFIRRTVDQLEEYDFLRNMAFNVHLTWNGGLEDVAAARKDFLKPYNYSSSFGNALSIRYKLHSIGIRLDPGDLSSVISAFLQKTADPDGTGDNDCLNRLIMFEHRRWVVETVAKGFRCLPREEFGVLRSSTKDLIGKRHPCLVPSTEKQNLGEEWVKNRHAKWNRATEEELRALEDPLDEMSVCLQRYFYDLSRREGGRIVREVNALLAQLGAMIPPAMGDTFDSYGQTVRAILFEPHDGNIDAVSYRYYRKNLERLVKAAAREAAEHEKGLWKAVSDTLDAVNDALFPLIEARAYTVWKTKDRDLISNIPFILTYNRDLHLLVPMEVEGRLRQNASALFGNVAAALMLNPAWISYAVEEKNLFGADGAVLPAFRRSLTFAARLMETHNLQTRVRLLVLCEREKGPLRGEEVAAVRALPGRIGYVKTVLYDSGNLRAGLTDFLRWQEDSACPVTAFANNETRISGCLNGCLRSDGTPFPSFSFDSVTQRFYDCDERVRWFSYIPFRPSLRVDDLFVPKEKRVVFREPVLFRYYNKFWKLYKPDGCWDDPVKEAAASSAWKRLAARLSGCVDENLMTVCTNASAAEPTESVCAFLPALCREGLVKLFGALEREGVVRPEKDGAEMVTSASMSMVRVSALTTGYGARALKALFCHPEKLYDKDRIYWKRSPEQIYFYYDNLSVEDFTADPETDGALLSLLDVFNEEGFLPGYRRPAHRGDPVSFSFCSPEIKRLLTNEGNVLELFAYYRAIASGAFDDVKTNCVVSWNGSLTNEFDIIATRGFNTYIFECKACETLTQDMYHKLFALAYQFGINNHAFLLADFNGRESSRNLLQMDRGAEYGVTTLRLPPERPAAEGGGLKELFRRVTRGEAPGDEAL